MERTPTVVLTVFWCGTDGLLDPPTTQIGVFASLAEGDDVTAGIGGRALDRRDGEAPRQLTIRFNGCGQTHGTRGALFAHGLKSQCALVVARVQQLLAAGHVVKLVCLGLSRGGMAVLLLVQRLPASADLTVHTCIFDPVPGNLILSSTWLDACTRRTMANQCLVLRWSVKCNWQRNLAIYPHEPLPSIAFHAPILPSYPKSVRVEEDATLGCHQGALFPLRVGLEARLSFVRLWRFLDESGTSLSEARTARYLSQQNVRADGGGKITSVEQLERQCLLECDSMIDELRSGRRDPGSTTRHAHAWRASTIQRRKSGDYLNHHHVQLATRFRGSAAPPAAGSAEASAVDASTGRSPTTPLTDVNLLLRVNRKAPRLGWARWTIAFVAVVATCVLLAEFA